MCVGVVCMFIMLSFGSVNESWDFELFLEKERGICLLALCLQQVVVQPAV